MDWKLTKLRWAARALMLRNTFNSYIMYWIGIYFPLWIINLLVNICELQKLVRENESGDKIILDFYSIRYEFNYTCGGKTSIIQRDLTSRMLWFLYYVGDTYDESMVYAFKIKVPNNGTIKIGMPGEVVFE